MGSLSLEQQRPAVDWLPIYHLAGSTFGSPARQTVDIPMVPIVGIYAGRPLASRELVLSHFPNAEYTQIPGTGHFLMLEKPEEFNRLLLAYGPKTRIRSIRALILN